MHTYMTVIYSLFLIFIQTKLYAASKSCRGKYRIMHIRLVLSYFASIYDFMYYGSIRYLLDRLQSVLNLAARLILGVPRFDSVSAAMRNELHWLPIGKRIQFKIALFVQHCISLVLRRVSDGTLSSGEFILWSALSTLCLTW